MPKSDFFLAREEGRDLGANHSICISTSDSVQASEASVDSLELPQPTEDPLSTTQAIEDSKTVHRLQVSPTSGTVPDLFTLSLVRGQSKWTGQRTLSSVLSKVTFG